MSTVASSQEAFCREREHQHLDVLFYFLELLLFLCWLHWVELLRLWDFRLHAFVDVTGASAHQVVSGPWFHINFDPFWTSSTFKTGGVKCTERLVSCVGETDEAFGIFQESNPFGNDRGNRVPEGLDLNRSPLSKASGLSAPHLHTNHQQLLGQHKLRREDWYLLETRRSRAGRTRSITHRNFHIIVSNSNSI